MSLEQLLAYVLDPDLLERYGPRFVDGLLVTGKLVAISFTLGALLGLLLALARMSRSLVLQRLAAGYVYFFRGSPLLAQLFLLYYGLGSLKGFWQDVGLWWFFREAWYCALLAFTLNTAAYQAEIFRASLMAVAPGQYEAAKVLGMNYGQTMRRVVLPQMVRNILPPMSNETITLVKDTSLIYVLALNDLLRAARGIVQRDFTTTPFIVAAAFYLVMTLVLTWAFQRLEQRYAKFDQ